MPSPWEYHRAHILPLRNCPLCLLRFIPVSGSPMGPIGKTSNKITVNPGPSNFPVDRKLPRV